MESSQQTPEWSDIMSVFTDNPMDMEKRVLFDTFRSQDVISLLSRIEQFYKTAKNAESSEKSRKQGNALFYKSSHDRSTHIKIFKLYCESIAFAPNDSTELAFGYGNRSAFLFHIKKYQACIEDIDKALSIHEAENLKKKLLDRKALCLEALRLSNNSNELNIQSSSPTCATDVKKEDSEKDNYALFTKEMTDIFEDIDIGYSEKYGRHLIAKQNFKPGDIVFVEKIYTQFLTTPWTHTNCSHCLKTCWSGIPCDHCNWSMFCSEGCKSDAWKKYHEIECPIISCLKAMSDRDKLGHYLPIRTLIIGLNDAGSLKNLEDEIASLDPIKDDCWFGFKNQGKFLKNRFHSVNSLSCQFKMTFTQQLSLYEIVAFTLTIIAKETTIFGRKFKSMCSESLINIPGAMFLGLLLAKMTRSILINGIFMQNSQIGCIYKNDNQHCKQMCCIKGQGVAPIASLINHSCDPNVARCFTEDGKVAFVALSPIKKNSQIFRCYYTPFAANIKENRQRHLLRQYGFICCCPACEQDWIVYSLSHNFRPRFEEQVTPSQMKIFKKCRGIVKYAYYPVFELKMDIDNAISILSKSIMKLFKISELPSSLICWMMQSLNVLLSKKYGFEIHDLGEC